MSALRGRGPSDLKQRNVSPSSSPALNFFSSIRPFILLVLYINLNFVLKQRARVPCTVVCVFCTWTRRDEIRLNKKTMVHTWCQSPWCCSSSYFLHLNRNLPSPPLWDLVAVGCSRQRWWCLLHWSSLSLESGSGNFARSGRFFEEKSWRRSFYFPLSFSFLSITAVHLRPFFFFLCTALNVWAVTAVDGCSLASLALWLHLGAPSFCGGVRTNHSLNSCQSLVHLLVIAALMWIHLVGFCWLMAFSWWLVETFVNFIWETAILNSCKATSKFIGLYLTSEHCRLHRTNAVQIWILLCLFWNHWCSYKGRESEVRGNIPL